MSRASSPTLPFSLLLLALASCGGGGGSSTPPVAANGNLRVASVAVVDQPPSGPAAGHEIVVRTVLEASRAYPAVAVSYLLMNKADLAANVKPVRTVLLDTAQSFQDVPAGSSVHDQAVLLPGTIFPAGGWALVAVMDPANSLPESDERDNAQDPLQAPVLTIDTSHANQPDLVMVSAEVDRAGFNPFDSVGSLAGQLAGQLGITPVCNQHFSVNIEVTASGGAVATNVPLSMQLDLPDSVDVPGLGTVTLPAVLSNVRIPIPLAMFQTVGGLFGTSFVIDSIRPGETRTINIPVCVPDANLTTVPNPFLFLNSLHLPWAPVGPTTPTISLAGLVNEFVKWVKTYVQNVHAVVIESIPVALTFAMNAQNQVAEFEAGIRRGLGIRTDNSLTRRIQLFESLLDQFPGTEPMTFASGYHHTFRTANLEAGVEIAANGAVDRTGGHGGFTAALPMTVFGQQLDLVRISANGDAGPNGLRAPQFAADVQVLGATVATASLGGAHLTLSTSLDYSLQRTLFQSTFLVGGIPMQASIKAGGATGVALNVDLDANGASLALELRPYANLAATAEVSVQAVVVEFGARFVFTFVELSYPIRSTATMQLLSGNRLQCQLVHQAVIEIDGPSGKALLYVKIGLPVVEDFLGSFGVNVDLTLVEEQLVLFELRTMELRNVLAERSRLTTFTL